MREDNLAKHRRKKRRSKSPFAAEKVLLIRSIEEEYAKYYDVIESYLIAMLAERLLAGIEVVTSFGKRTVYPYDVYSYADIMKSRSLGSVETGLAGAFREVYTQIDKNILCNFTDRCIAVAIKKNEIPLLEEHYKGKRTAIRAEIENNISTAASLARKFSIYKDNISLQEIYERGKADLIALQVNRYLYEHLDAYDENANRKRFKERHPINLSVRFYRQKGGVCWYADDENPVIEAAVRDAENKLLRKEDKFLAQKKKESEINRILSDLHMENPPALYPKARGLRRHFILHIGPTNSGKTHDALEDLKKAESGLYLAPLRLLALEVQERLLADGVICSMTTGEEDDFREGARHLSCTVEKMYAVEHVGIDPAVAVIDEAQMIEDMDRGWAWLQAILGLPCPRIHVCMSENARNLIIKLIGMCRDTYEIVEHTRDTDLITEDKDFHFPNEIHPQDALVVFSKKKVLSVASELEHRGIRTSVVYGALPYTARKEEVRKFIAHESDVVVCTDAIGMGMNLPIRRVVFLETEKFDGHKLRMLKENEVKQIAGRAGRRGLYETGYVNAMENREEIGELLEAPPRMLTYASIQMPEVLLEADMSLPEIIARWMQTPETNLIKKASMQQQMRLAQTLEKPEFKKLGLSKAAKLALINIPFDDDNKQLFILWKELILMHYSGGDIAMLVPVLQKDLSLEKLETLSRQLDLLFSFARTCGKNDDKLLDEIRTLKDETADMIILRLKRKNFVRRCTHCGKVLPWDFPYSVCNKCHGVKAYSGRRRS